MGLYEIHTIIENKRFFYCSFLLIHSVNSCSSILLNLIFLEECEYISLTVGLSPIKHPSDLRKVDLSAVP